MAPGLKIAGGTAAGSGGTLSADLFGIGAPVLVALRSFGKLRSNLPSCLQERWFSLADDKHLKWDVLEPRAGKQL